MLKPIDRASLETAHRVVCGDSGKVTVFEDGHIFNGAAFKLEPARDPIDALIVAVSQAVKLHLSGVDLGQLRGDLVAAGMREETANCVHNHLVDFSVEDWAKVRARVVFYTNDSARMAAYDTKKAGNT